MGSNLGLPLISFFYSPITNLPQKICYETIVKVALFNNFLNLCHISHLCHKRRNKKERRKTNMNHDFI